jgi:hypothetical protein
VCPEANAGGRPFGGYGTSLSGFAREGQLGHHRLSSRAAMRGVETLG